MSDRKLNEGLQTKQERDRQSSINKIRTVIQILKDEGYRGVQISLTKIVDTSKANPEVKVSRALLDKKHIIEVLKEEGVGPYTPRRIMRLTPEKLEKELAKAMSDVKRLRETLEDEKRKKEDLRDKLEKEKRNSSILRALMQEMYLYADNHKVNLQHVIDNPRFILVE